MVQDTTQTAGVKVGDLVFPTNKAVEECPQLADLWRGGTIKNIDGDGVAEIHLTTVLKVNVSRLTTGPDAYDPIP